MGRFLFFATVALALISCNDSGTSAPEAVDARALHDRILTFDTEMDYPPDFMEGLKDAAEDGPRWPRRSPVRGLDGDGRARRGGLRRGHCQS